MKNILLTILLLCNSYGSAAQKNLNLYLRTGLDEWYLDTIILSISTDKHQNLLFVVKSEDNFLNDAEGVGMSCMPTREDVKKIKTGKGPVNSFLITTVHCGMPHFGLTFHVVWADVRKNTVFWEITRIPLIDPEAKDIDGDGVVEFIENHIGYEEKVPKVYKFDNGELIEIKK